MLIVEFKPYSISTRWQLTEMKIVHSFDCRWNDETRCSVIVSNGNDSFQRQHIATRSSILYIAQSTYNIQKHSFLSSYDANGTLSKECRKASFDHNWHKITSQTPVAAALLSLVYQIKKLKKQTKEINQPALDYINLLIRTKVANMTEITRSWNEFGPPQFSPDISIFHTHAQM